MTKCSLLFWILNDKANYMMPCWTKCPDPSMQITDHLQLSFIVINVSKRLSCIPDLNSEAKVSHLPTVLMSFKVSYNMWEKFLMKLKNIMLVSVLSHCHHSLPPPPSLPHILPTGSKPILMDNMKMTFDIINPCPNIA